MSHKCSSNRIYTCVLQQNLTSSQIYIHVACYNLDVWPYIARSDHILKHVAACYNVRSFVAFIYGRIMLKVTMVVVYNLKVLKMFVPLGYFGLGDIETFFPLQYFGFARIETFWYEKSNKKADAIHKNLLSYIKSSCVKLF